MLSPQPSRIPRRRLRFSLRTLLVVTTLVGVCLGWWVHIANQRGAVSAIRSLARSELIHYSYQTIEPAAPDWQPGIDKNATSWAPKFLLEALGKDVFHTVRHVRIYRVDDDQREEIAEQISRLSEVRHLEFVQISATDAMVERLVKLRNLRTLQLRGDLLTDESLRLIGRLPCLEALHIGGSFTNAGLMHLRQLATLRCLTLESPHITGRGLAAIAELSKLETVQLKPPLPDGLAELKACESLTSLSLRSAKVTDRDLQQIAALTSLKRLDLSGNNLIGSGLRHLHGLRNLRDLDLSACGITDDSTKLLASLRSLHMLDLSHSPRLTDVGMAPLAALSDLKVLNLESTCISIDGVLYLKELTGLRRLVVPPLPECGTGMLEREILGLPPFGLSPDHLRLLQQTLPKCTVEFQP